MHPLYKYCTTDRQREILDAIEAEDGSPVGAARKLKVGRRYVFRVVAKLREAAELHEASNISTFPRTDTCRDGMFTERMTVQSSKGVEERRWDKHKVDEKIRFEAARLALESVCEGLPAVPKIAKPKRTKSRLLVQYTITDFHLGMFAWEAEGGIDWDEEVAKRVLWEAYGNMLDRSPDAETGLLVNLGDFLHWDGLIAVTNAHGNVLDARMKYAKLCDLALSLMIWMVEEARKKHKRVHIICCEGNHDEAGALWIRAALKHMYASEPRVTVDENPTPYTHYVHGQYFLGYHHGHKRKEQKLHEVFSGDPRFRADWGACKYSMGHTGHLHDERLYECGGMIVERHPTLSARESYTVRAGYHSRRAAHAICYDTHDGEVSRVSEVPRS